MLRLALNVLLCVMLVGCGGGGDDLTTGARLASGEGGSATIRLAWDPPTDAGGRPQSRVTGYYLYFGPDSGIYDVSLDVGLRTSLTLSGLHANQPYYFAVTAYDGENNQSDFSNEVCAIPLPDTVELCDG